MPSLARPRGRKTKGRKLAENFISGAAGGAAGVVVAHPLDTVKVNLQAGWGGKAGGGAKAAGPVAVARKIFREGGARGFYKGVGGAVGGTAPAVAARMAMYEVTKGALASTFPGSPAAVQAASAVLGELAGAAFRNPFELVKQRLQAGVMGGGAIGALRSVVAAEGVAGLYTGVGPALARDIPQTVVNFLVYERLTEAVRKGKTRTGGGGAARLETWESLGCGAAAGGVSALLTCPIDVVKTKVMTDSSRIDARALGSKPPGIGLVMRRVVKEEGYRGFFRGSIPRTLLIMPDVAVLWMVYEICKNLFDGEEEEGEEQGGK